MKRSIYTTASLGALILPGVVQAQVEFELEEIVVTAQRIEQTLQNAAVAVDALAQDDLIRAGAENARDLGRISPSIGINEGGGVLTSIYIRGVGAFTSNSLQDSGVAQNYDGVYLGRASASPGISFYDMERIEVLKGPQGTLYGRNATGGVLNFIPAKPVLDKTSGYAQVEAGNFGKSAVQGGVNVALGDKVAARVAGNVQERDAYNDDGTSDLDSMSFRGSILFAPSDNFDLRLAADYSKIDNKGNGGTPVGVFDAQGDQTNFTPSDLDIDSGPSSEESNALRVLTVAAPAFTPNPPIDSDNLFVDADYTGIHAEINYQTDVGRLTFIPAYREYDHAFTFAGPGFAPASNEESGEQVSLELRFASEFDGPVNGVVGAFYFDEEVDFAANFNQVAISAIQNWTNGGDSHAIFGQLTFELQDDFRATAGLRYTEDNKFVRGNDYVFISVCLLPDVPLFPGSDITIPDLAGCGALDIPAHPITANPNEWIAELVAGGYIPPDKTTVNEGPVPILTTFGPDGPGAIILDSGAGENLSEDDSWYAPTYKLGLEYDLRDDSLLYFNFERGYRSGGVDLGDSTDGTVRLSYDPEFINAFTLGSKNRFLSNTLQVNLEAFYWEYKDQQISFFSIRDGAPNFGTANGDSTIQGLDVDIQWAASAATTLGAKMQYLDSTLDRLILRSDEGTGRFGCADIGVQNGLQTFDCAGETLLYAPEFAVDASLQHVFELGEFNLIGYADASYRSEQETDLSFVSQTRADSYVTFNLAATLTPSNESWGITAFVNNVDDERYLTTTSIATSGAFYGQYNPPRTYGVRFRADF